MIVVISLRLLFSQKIEFPAHGAQNPRQMATK